MSLQDKLNELKEVFASGKPPYNLPSHIFAQMEKATDELIASGAAENTLQVGDRAPEFTLDDSSGVRVSSAELLAQGPLVVSFYRGVWCPYCNLDLKALEEALPSYRELGANLVAVSPQTPVNSRKSQRSNDLTFPILSDPGNAVAASFGLRFELPDYLIEIYKNAGIDLVGFNSDSSGTLPMPSRFVISQDSLIRYAEVNPDYTRRPEPEDILPTLRAWASTSRTAS